MTIFNDALHAEAYPPGIERTFWHRARNRVIADTLRRVCGLEDWVLEVGCGRGIVVDYLRTQRFECFGCELGGVPVPPHLQGIVFPRTDCSDLPRQLRERVRVAMALDVIEHVEEPRHFLSHIRESLPGVEVLIVTVPARPELWSKWDEHYGHCRRYSRRSVIEELSAAGLGVLSARYFFHSLYLPTLFLQKMGMERNVAVAAPRQSGVHALVGRLMAAEARILPGRLFGTSLIAVARFGRA